MLALVWINPALEPMARRTADLGTRHVRTSASSHRVSCGAPCRTTSGAGHRSRQTLRSALADRSEDRIGRLTVPLVTA